MGLCFSKSIKILAFEADFIRGCLNVGSAKRKPETRTQVQMVYLRDDLRNHK